MWEGTWRFFSENSLHPSDIKKSQSYPSTTKINPSHMWCRSESWDFLRQFLFFFSSKKNIFFPLFCSKKNVCQKRTRKNACNRARASNFVFFSSRWIFQLFPQLQLPDILHKVHKLKTRGWWCAKCLQMFNLKII